MADSQLQRLVEVMDRLRSPGGCPWDAEQTHESLIKYLLEESYEFIDAIETDDRAGMREELGDVLLQVYFHSRIAQDHPTDPFSIEDVAGAIADKLIRRHPHVFGDMNAHSPKQVKTLWDDIKAQEKADRRAARKAAGYVDSEPSTSVLAGVPEALPALIRAEKIQSKASKVGFDWNDPLVVLDKIEEETAEIKDAMASGSKAEISEEIGDLLFAVVNLARHLKVDPEQALRSTNSKFFKRFSYIERTLEARNKPIKDATLDEMEALWQEAKLNV